MGTCCYDPYYGYGPNGYGAYGFGGAPVGTVGVVPGAYPAGVGFGGAPLATTTITTTTPAVGVTPII